MHQDLEKEKKAKEREELRLALEKQLAEREALAKRNVLMDPREKKIHQEMLKNLNDNRFIAFPGVPGVHMNESPIKQNFARVYGNQVDSMRENENFYKKNSKTPQPFLDVSKSHEYGIHKKNYVFPDPYKHDPITNPIGSELPRVLPGQRSLKVPQSQSRLAMAGNAVFKL